MPSGVIENKDEKLCAARECFRRLTVARITPGVAPSALSATGTAAVACSHSILSRAVAAGRLQGNILESVCPSMHRDDAGSGSSSSRQAVALSDDVGTDTHAHRRFRRRTTFFRLRFFPDKDTTPCR